MCLCVCVRESVCVCVCICNSHACMLTIASSLVLLVVNRRFLSTASRGRLVRLKHPDQNPNLFSIAPASPHHQSLPSFLKQAPMQATTTTTTTTTTAIKAAQGPPPPSLPPPPWQQSPTPGMFDAYTCAPFVCITACVLSSSPLCFLLHHGSDHQPPMRCAFMRACYLYLACMHLSSPPSLRSTHM